MNLTERLLFRGALFCLLALGASYALITHTDAQTRTPKRASLGGFA